MLLLGPPGAGKSDLLLRLIDRGFALVADDRVDLADGVASAPASLAGLLEVRGLGLFRLPHVASAPVALAVELRVGERLPRPAIHPASGLPLVQIDPGARLRCATRGAGARLCVGPHGAGRGRLRLTPRRVVLVTGLSGAGRTSILRVLEDLGYEAVDNPPLTLTEELVRRGDRPVAIGLDARSRGFDADAVLATLERLRLGQGLRPELLFALADEAALLRRYTETRRRHPLADGGRVSEGIAQEVRLTAALRDAADLVIDTTELSLPALRRVIEGRFGGISACRLTVSLMSFAYPHGLPREADLVFDARFLRNPHYDPPIYDSRHRAGRRRGAPTWRPTPDFSACPTTKCRGDAPVCFCPGSCRRERNT